MPGQRRIVAVDELSALLSILEPGPMHGYAVIEALRARSSGRLTLPTGTVYPALQRLDRAGLASSSWSTVSGRRRRTYQLTPAGQQALQRERSAWHEFAATVAPILVGVPWPTTL
jgi:PadR family transcriptional regulator, regulatory protein PadR